MAGESVKQMDVAFMEGWVLDGVLEDEGVHISLRLEDGNGRDETHNGGSFESDVK